MAPAAEHDGGQARYAPLLRPLGEGDAPALAVLYDGRDEAAGRTFRPLGDSPCDPARCAAVVAAATARPPRAVDLVIEEHGRLIGWGFVWNLRDPEPLFGLLVDARHRGHGLGRLLAEEVLAAADEAEVPKVHLTVVADNRAAIGLYESLGLVDTGGFVHDDGLAYRRMVRHVRVRAEIHASYCAEIVFPIKARRGSILEVFHSKAKVRTTARLFLRSLYLDDGCAGMEWGGSGGDPCAARRKAPANKKPRGRRPLQWPLGMRAAPALRER